VERVLKKDVHEEKLYKKMKEENSKGCDKKNTRGVKISEEMSKKKGGRIPKEREK